MHHDRNRLEHLPATPHEALRDPKRGLCLPRKCQRHRGMFVRPAKETIATHRSKPPARSQAFPPSPNPGLFPLTGQVRSPLPPAVFTRCRRRHGSPVQVSCCFNNIEHFQERPRETAHPQPGTMPGWSIRDRSRSMIAFRPLYPLLRRILENRRTRRLPKGTAGMVQAFFRFFRIDHRQRGERP